ncbi:MAG: DUF11 domain-containing protein, partial [Anaerolineae bacterium]
MKTMLVIPFFIIAGLTLLPLSMSSIDVQGIESGPYDKPVAAQYALPSGTDPSGGQADLSIAKSDNPDPVSPGETLTYRLTIFNSGPNAASNVVVRDLLSIQVSYQETNSPPDWSCSHSGGPFGGTVTCTKPTLEPGGSAEIIITVLVDTSSIDTIKNKGKVTSSTSDPNLNNNTYVEYTKIVTPTLTYTPTPTDT